MAARDDVIAVAKTYLDGILAGDGSIARLAPGAWRVEQGMNSGRNADEIRRSLDRMGGMGMRNLRWFVDGENAIAYFMLDVGDFTSFVIERFRVVDGQITEIEVHFHGRPGAKLEPWPDDPSQVWPTDADGHYIIS